MRHFGAQGVRSYLLRRGIAKDVADEMSQADNGYLICDAVGGKEDTLYETSGQRNDEEAPVGTSCKARFLS